MARRLQQAHPGWLVLWGTYSREFWAYPCLPVPRGTILHAPDADTLATRIRETSLRYFPPAGPIPAISGAREPGRFPSRPAS